VRVADDHKEALQHLSAGDVTVRPTGASMLWSDFNEANLDAMLKSEMVSWPVTLVILVLAFGALLAAGLPLVLTLAGLVASAGSLVLINQVVPVSIWAMNFAMMFALALGIDYALFIVQRYRAARITSIPTLMAFKEGQLVFSQPGALPAPALEQLIEGVKSLDMSEATAGGAS